jgi:hypothetical protein
MSSEEPMKGIARPIARSVVLLPYEKQKVQLLSPFFLTNQLRRSIERLLPPSYHRRLSLYFECYGCIGCKRKDVLYVCNGLCRPCLKRISKRLQKIDRKFEKESHTFKDDRDEAYLLRFRSAREMLSDLLPKAGKRVSKKNVVGKPAPRIYLK